MCSLQCRYVMDTVMKYDFQFNYVKIQKDSQPTIRTHCKLKYIYKYINKYIYIW